jgi:hypothetical protein
MVRREAVAVVRGSTSSVGSWVQIASTRVKSA